jgi:hypothetical protein
MPILCTKPAIAGRGPGRDLQSDKAGSDQQAGARQTGRHVEAEATRRSFSMGILKNLPFIGKLRRLAVSSAAAVPGPTSAGPVDARQSPIVRDAMARKEPASTSGVSSERLASMTIPVRRHPQPSTPPSEQPSARRPGAEPTWNSQKEIADDAVRAHPAMKLAPIASQGQIQSVSHERGASVVNDLAVPEADHAKAIKKIADFDLSLSTPKNIGSSRPKLVHFFNVDGDNVKKGSDASFMVDTGMTKGEVSNYEKVRLEGVKVPKIYGYCDEHPIVQFLPNQITVTDQVGGHRRVYRENNPAAKNNQTVAT